MSDRATFWAAVQTLAEEFRHEDPALSGRLKALVGHFHTLPSDLQSQLRLDVQLLTVQFSRLALAMTLEMDEEESRGEEG